MINKLREFYASFKYKRRGISIDPRVLCKELEKSQFWKRDEIEKFQLKNINNLLYEANKNVKYYQNKKFNKHLPYENINLFSKSFPLLTKDEINLNLNDLLNPQVGQSITHTTSGSTGTPTSLEISGLAEAYRIANRMRFYKWWNINVFDRNVMIWNLPVQKRGGYGFLKKMESKFLGILRLHIFDLNEETIQDYFNKIENFKPKFLRGYKSGVFELARLMEKNNLSFKKTKLNVAIVTSESLFDYEKELIEKVFGCKVANEYGSADAGQFAYQCPEGNSLHINEESVYISTDKDNNAYVTELFNNAMPLINFKNEDRIILSDEICSCGRSLKVIKKVEGRISDFILCQDGTKKNSLIFLVIFSMVEIKFNSCVKQFKVFQFENKLHIHVIPGENFDQKVSDYLKLLIQQKTCDQFEVDILLVNQIQREKSGKIKYFQRVG